MCTGIIDENNFESCFWRHWNYSTPMRRLTRSIEFATKIFDPAIITPLRQYRTPTGAAEQNLSPILRRSLDRPPCQQLVALGSSGDRCA
jgi:hypothetical protein